MPLFNNQDAEVALDIAGSLVERMFDERWIRRRDFHLMISLRQVDGTFTILAEKSFGNVEDCKQKYKPIAEHKTEISARTGLSSREVQLMRPDLLKESDTIYWGSAIQGDIIVAGSGVQAFVDETIAKSTLAICLMLIQQAFTALKEHAELAGTSYYHS